MLKFNARPAALATKDGFRVNLAATMRARGAAGYRIGGGSGQRRNSTMPTEWAVPFVASARKVLPAAIRVRTVALGGDGEKIEPTGAQAVPLC
jgi:hypothetical protein